MKKLDVNECKSLVFKAAIECGVSPRIIITELLTDDDKKDIENGELKLAGLILHVKTWLNSGKPNLKAK